MDTRAQINSETMDIQSQQYQDQPRQQPTSPSIPQKSTTTTNTINYSYPFLAPAVLPPTIPPRRSLTRIADRERTRTSTSDTNTNTNSNPGSGAYPQSTSPSNDPQQSSSSSSITSSTSSPFHLTTKDRRRSSSSQTSLTVDSSSEGMSLRSYGLATPETSSDAIQVGGMGMGMGMGIGMGKQGEEREEAQVMDSPVNIRMGDPGGMIFLNSPQPDASQDKSLTTSRSRMMAPISSPHQSVSNDEIISPKMMTGGTFASNSTNSPEPNDHSETNISRNLSRPETPRTTSGGSIQTRSSVDLPERRPENVSGQSYKTARMVREEELEKKSKARERLPSRDGHLVVGGVPKKASSTGVYTPPTFPGPSGPRPSAYPSNVYTPSNFSGPSTPNTPATPASSTASQSSYFSASLSPIEPAMPNSADQYAEIKRQRFLGSRLSGFSVNWPTKSVGSNPQGRTSLDEKRLESTFSDSSLQTISEGPKTAPLPTSSYIRKQSYPVVPSASRAESLRDSMEMQRGRASSANGYGSLFGRVQSGLGLGVGLVLEPVDVTNGRPSSDLLGNRNRNVKNLTLDASPEPQTGSSSVLEHSPPIAATLSLPLTSPPETTSTTSANVVVSKMKRKPVPKVRESMLMAPAPASVKSVDAHDGRQRQLEVAPLPSP